MVGIMIQKGDQGRGPNDSITLSHLPPQTSTVLFETENKGEK